MAFLSDEDKRLLLGPTGNNCPVCHKTEIRNYCRDCDVFFVVCSCAQTTSEHDGHSTY